MFQYACGKALAFKHNTELLIDVTSFKTPSKNGVTNRELTLNIFNINASEANKNELIKAKPILFRVINTLFIKFFFKGIQTPKYFIERKFSFNKRIIHVGENCYLSGYWQSPKYFNSVELLIRKEFIFPNNLNSQNNEFLNKILSENSVSLHIRRTDFVNNTSHDIHGFCSIEYYENSIHIISQKIAKPYFFIFSDDIEWAKKNLQISFCHLFIFGNFGNNSYIDMQLMSKCKHNIIANSSFSWWGAWLNQNKNKIVIAPKIWFLNKNLNDQTQDLIPDSWIRM